MIKKILSVGFADLSKFDAFMKKHGAEESVQALNEAFKKAGDVIIKNGGILRKYLGDAVLFTLEDPAVAEKTANEIVRCFSTEKDGIKMRFQVSIATGEVLLAKIGHHSYVVDDIYGTVVNTAAKQLKTAARSPKKYVLCRQTKNFHRK